MEAKCPKGCHRWNGRSWEVAGASKAEYPWSLLERDKDHYCFPSDAKLLPNGEVVLMIPLEVAVDFVMQSSRPEGYTLRHGKHDDRLHWPWAWCPSCGAQLGVTSSGQAWVRPEGWAVAERIAEVMDAASTSDPDVCKGCDAACYGGVACGDRCKENLLEYAAAKGGGVDASLD
jgi:hypothetical protein